MSKFKGALGKFVLPTVASLGVRTVVTRGATIAAGVAATAVIASSSSSSSPARGIDFAWGAPSAATMVAHGWQFGAGYLSNDPSKNWTRARVDSFHRAGVATAAVWETTANRAAQGYAAGCADAQAAAAQLRALGAPATEPFDMAIDFDANGPEVASYFTGADNCAPGRVNAYGGYRPLLYLYNHHLVGTSNWQTYAWSGGLWLPAHIAPLEQYLNGSSFDYDRYLRRFNKGGWLFGSVVPLKPTDPWALYDKTRRHFHTKHGLVIASEHNTVRTWDRAHCRNPVKRPICKSTHYHLVLLAGRLYHVAYTHSEPHPAGFGNGRPSWSIPKGHPRGSRYAGIAHRINQK